ncbi:MAG: hypothetical protein WBE47_08235 [Candidatus Acidiferrales bacterium]
MTVHVHSIAQAAKRAGISEGLLILWIETKRITPSIELSTRDVDFSKYPAAVRNLLSEDRELWGWNRFVFTDEDIERLHRMVESTAQRRDKAEASHIAGTAYSPQELAALWGLSADTIRELFENESGVIVVGHSGNRRKRGYHTLRIPEAVAARVQKRLSNL